ncbi:MAG: helix-turn-helix domain-containing protein [Deltaproteobacteria bacterium]|nr:helix-turn-helix domain-containing protein [Deltaproteobacteria bacterium]
MKEKEFTEKQINGLLTMRQAGRYLGVCYRTMQRLVYERKIGFVKMYSEYRFRIEDLDKFIILKMINEISGQSCRFAC